MPPGQIPNPTKRKVRPSSAAAKIQSHPCYSTGLYDDNNGRPSTAVPGSSGQGLGQRPKTQAAGRRFPYSTESSTPSIPEVPVPPVMVNGRTRRLTVGPVDNIAETHQAALEKYQPSTPATTSS